MLAYFDGDRARFHAFVESDITNTMRSRPNAETLASVVDLVLEEREDPVGPGVRRTILLLTLDRVASTAHRERLARSLEINETRLLHKALWRARRRSDQQHELVDIVERVLELWAES